MESWMISLGAGLITFVSMLAVLRYMTTEQKSQITILFERIDKHGDAIIELRASERYHMTSKDADERYVSKELFQQHEKHIDSRFDRIDKGQKEIRDLLKEYMEG